MKNNPSGVKKGIPIKNHVVLENDGLMVTESTFVDREVGVVAKRNYKAGEILFLVKGPIVSQPSKYSFSLSIDEHIEPERPDGLPDFGHYTNHSCDPTALVRAVRKENEAPYIEVIARKDINTGEELTFDYASLEYEVTIAGKECKCKSGVCRGKIHGFKDLPADIVEKYKREGLLPDHLLLIQEVSSKKKR